MSGYYYIGSEPGLWTVGSGTRGVDWEPESDHGSIREAVARVAYLNGGPAPDADDSLRASIAGLVEQLGSLAQVLRPVAEHLAAGVETSPAGRDTEPSPEVPAVATTGQPGSTPVDERAEQIAGLRELADFLETHLEVPHYRYGGAYDVHVSNLPDLQDVQDEAAMFAELARIGEALDVNADLRDEPGVGHPHATKAFRGGVHYKAVYVTKAYRRGYKPADAATTDIPRGGEEVAGPAGEAGPATAPKVTHTQVAAWGGVPGSSGVECSCGVTYDGFDTIAEAEALRAAHADRDDDEGPATAPEPDPCPKGDPGCETGDDGSCHDGCVAPESEELDSGEQDRHRPDACVGCTYLPGPNYGVRVSSAPTCPVHGSEG